MRFFRDTFFLSVCLFVSRRSKKKKREAQIGEGKEKIKKKKIKIKQIGGVWGAVDTEQI